MGVLRKFLGLQAKTGSKSSLQIGKAVKRGISEPDFSYGWQKILIFDPKIYIAKGNFKN